MSNTPHELHEEFPEHADLIHNLKTSDGHFAKLADDYHKVNRTVHRAETLIEPISADAETTLRKERALLKDQIAAYLASQPTS